MKVLVVGGCGYIGSRLIEHLSPRHSVFSSDIEWWGNPTKYNNNKQDALEITAEQIEQFDSVVLLAGHSSVQMCEHNFMSAYHNNVSVFIHLNKIMHDQQKLIYASSSSVYGQRVGTAHEEDPLNDPVNAYDHTKQLIDNITLNALHTRQDMLRPIFPDRKNYCNNNVYGLRFGTVCGYSPNFRSDVMVNAMWDSAKKNGEVRVFNGDTRRTLLSITDCCRAIETLITCSSVPNIYNLGSVDSTSIAIGNAVAEQMGVPCIETEAKTVGNAKMTTKNYDFWINSNKFERHFDFEFKDTIESMVEDIQLGMTQAKLQGIDQKIANRARYVEYDAIKSV